MVSARTAESTVATDSSAPVAAVVHFIGIAGMCVVKAPDKVRTVLGSCIGIAMYDTVAKIGALGHVILPDSTEGTGDPAKFADTAVDMLLERLVDAGAVRARVTAKIVGGAAMFSDERAAGLGRRNAESVEARLRHHGICLAASAVGGQRGRKLVLDPATGAVQVEIIGEKPETI